MSSSERLDIALEPGKLPQSSENYTNTTLSLVERDQEEMCSTVCDADADATARGNGPNDDNSCSTSSQYDKDRYTVIDSYDSEVQLNISGCVYLDSERTHDKCDNSQQTRNDANEAEPGRSDSVNYVSPPASELESETQETRKSSQTSSKEITSMEQQSDGDNTTSSPGVDGTHEESPMLQIHNDSTQEAGKDQTHSKNNDQNGGDQHFHFNIGEFVSDVQMAAFSIIFPSHHKKDPSNCEVNKTSDCIENQGVPNNALNQTSKEEVSEDFSNPESVVERDTVDSVLQDDMNGGIGIDEVECFEGETNGTNDYSSEERPLLQQHDALHSEQSDGNAGEFDHKRCPADDRRNEASPGLKNLKEKCTDSDLASSPPEIIDTDDEYSDTSNDSSEKMRYVINSSFLCKRCFNPICLFAISF